MSLANNFDEIFYHVLSSESDIVSFFDRIFDFLYRRTDYFKIKNDASSLGLAPGEAENIVKGVFCKYMQKALDNRSTELSEIQTEHDIPLDCVSEETVVTSTEDESDGKKTLQKEETPTKLEGGESTVSPTDVDQDVRVPLMDPECYNGASYEGYSWSQSLRDADVRLKVPSSVLTAKHVRVHIQPFHIKVEILVSDSWNVLKEADILFKIKMDESTWTLVPKECIHICLQKVQEKWWDAFFTDEPRIDLKAIDASIPYSELDLDSQNKIEELMYNEHLKRQGKPTIQQNKIANILKEAWDADGSPFQGQPFDPSILDVKNADSL